MGSESTPVGETLVLTLSGRKVTGKVAEADAERLLVRVPIHELASGYRGASGHAVLPSGEIVDLDLTNGAHYSELLIEVPLPKRREAPAPAPVQERRRFFRLALELEVEVLETVGRGDVHVRNRGRTINLSGGGMLVAFAEPMLGGIYHMRVHLPGETLQVAGRVIPKPGMGANVAPVEFVDIHEVERSKLIRLIFNRMRNVKENERPAAEAPPTTKHEPAEAAPRYWRRHEKHYKPGKIRYW